MEAYYLASADPVRDGLQLGRKEEKEGNMNKYGALWKDLSVEVEADTTYKAQGLALPLLQAKAGRRKVKQYEITIALLQLDGVDYVHVAM